MKKLILLSMSVLLLFTATNSIAQTQVALNRAQLKSLTTAVDQAKRSSDWVISQKFKGNLKQMKQFIQKVESEIARQGLSDSIIPGFKTGAYVTLYQDPDSKPTIKLDVGLRVKGPVKVKKPLKLNQITHKKAAKVSYKGAYSGLAKMHSQLKIIANEGVTKYKTKWPINLIFITDPNTTKSSANYITEMIVPLKPVKTRSLTRRQITEIQEATRSKKKIKYSLVVQKFSGSMDQIELYLKQFMVQLSKQGIDKLISTTSRPIVILDGNPDENKKIKMLIGFQINKEVKVKKPLKIKKIKYKKAIQYTHSGEYRELSEIYKRAVKGLKHDMKSKPVMLRLLTNPRWAKTSKDIKVEIIVPLG
ncbi:hypothetical protein MNBD_GAMMA22-1923 [hydrothermal vent metagenome]|uniref:GyrI-like small molecule binding domain-containing protein n=1 Tax=hydrothermal vent metagenome TaxID=652676 RepID=A0A3B1A2D7_9ZZZZ